MSRIRTNLITNRMANGAPTVSHGLVISGVTTVTTIDLNGDLDVDGHLNADNVSIAGITTFTNSYVDFKPDNGGNAHFRILSTGSGDAGIFFDAANGDIAGSDYVFIGQKNNLDFVIDANANAGNIDFQRAGATQVSITSAGKVGINTNNPQALLEIQDRSVGTLIGLSVGTQYGNASFGGYNNYPAIMNNIGVPLLYCDTNNDRTILFGDTVGFGTTCSIRIGNAGIATVSAQGLNVTGIITATSFAPTTGQLSHRNIIINGACMVAQRATSSGSTGYQTVDRFKLGTGGADEAIQQYQGTVASHESPYNEGHRYSYYIMNGNQTGGAGSGDYAEIQYKVEAQDMATCGWNYTSASSFITLSFWVKSNVGQNFYGFVYSADGTAQRYIFETGTITANSWNKIVVTIPGGTNVQFDSNVNEGFIIKWIPFYGTDKTNNSATVGSWANYNGAARCPDMTSTWWTTDNSTFYITGVQLEVGSVVTPFEHRSYAEELLRCKRYYQRSTDSSRGSNYSLSSSSWHSADGVQSFCKHNNYYDFKERFEVEMRAAPTLTIYGSTTQGDIHIERVAVGSQEVDWNNNTTEVRTKGFLLRHIEDSYGTSGSGNGFGILAYTVDAEL